MSVAMVASFMPSMAFAATTVGEHTFAVNFTTNDGINTATDSWTDVKAASENKDTKDIVKVLKAPTHTEEGLVELHCTSKDYCDEVVEVVIPETGHPAKDFHEVWMTPDQYTAAKIAQKEMTKASAKTFVGNKYCKIKVEKCSCGVVDDFFDIAANHTNHPDGRKFACEKSAVCAACGKTIVFDENATHDHEATDTGVVVKKAAACGNGEVREYTCKYCKQKYTEVSKTKTGCTPKTVVTPSNKKTVGNAITYYDGKTAIATVTTPKKGPKTVSNVTAGYAVDVKSFDDPIFYKWDTVIKKADACGGEDTVGFTCEACGNIINAGDYANVKVATANAHDWETKEIPATCTTPVQEYKICKNCGTYKTAAGTTNDITAAEKTPKKDSKALGHKLEVKKVDATCANAAYYVVKCSACKKTVKVNASQFTEKNTSLWVNPANFVVNYEKHADSVELPYIETLKAGAAHKYTKQVVLKAATCTTPEISGYKCDNCGKVAAHGVFAPVVTAVALGHKDVKVHVAPTCGEYGYNIVKCERCNLYKDGAGKYVEDVRNAAQNIISTEKPLVAAGAAHKFDKWVVVKDSTVFEEGVKQLECSVCGAKDATKTIIAKKTVKKPVVTLKAGKKAFTVKASAANATGYKVVYKRAGKKAITKVVDAENLSKTYKKLAKGKKYTVKVTAFASNGTDTVYGATTTKTVKTK